MNLYKILTDDDHFYYVVADSYREAVHKLIMETVAREQSIGSLSILASTTAGDLIL